MCVHRRNMCQWYTSRRDSHEKGESNKVRSRMHAHIDPYWMRHELGSRSRSVAPSLSADRRATQWREASPFGNWLPTSLFEHRCRPPPRVQSCINRGKRGAVVVGICNYKFIIHPVPIAPLRLTDISLWHPILPSAPSNDLFSLWSGRKMASRTNGVEDTRGSGDGDGSASSPSGNLSRWSASVLLGRSSRGSLVPLWFLDSGR